MRATWPLALVLVASFGCRHSDAPSGEPAAKSGQTAADAPAAIADPLVKELSSRTGIPVYPGALIDKSRSQAYQHLGEIDQYTVPLTSGDPLKKVSDYYIRVLGGSYSGTPSSGKLISKLPDGSVTVSMEQGHDSGTTILLYASLNNPKPIVPRTAQEPPPQEPSEPTPQPAQQPEVTGIQPEQPQPTFRVYNPSIDHPTQPDEPAKPSSADGG